MVAVSRLGGTQEIGTKAPVRVETDAEIVLSGWQTIRTVALQTGDRVLVKDQTDDTENGIWNVQGEFDPWTRAADMNRPVDVNASVFIASQQTDIIYMIDVPPGTYWNPDATSINFNLFPSIGDAPIDGTPYARQDGGWVVSPPPVWGLITGTLSDQTDLQIELDALLPGGASGNLQFNDGLGGYEGSADLNWDGSSLFIAGDVNIGDASGATLVSINASGTANAELRLNQNGLQKANFIFDNSTTHTEINADFAIRFLSANTLALTLDNSQNATFAGNIALTGSIDQRADGLDAVILSVLTDYGTQTNRFFQIRTPAVDGAGEPFTFETGNAFSFETDGIERFLIDSTGNSLFTGNVAINSAGATGEPTLDFQQAGTSRADIAYEDLGDLWRFDHKGVGTTVFRINSVINMSMAQASTSFNQLTSILNDLYLGAANVMSLRNTGSNYIDVHNGGAGTVSGFRFYDQGVLSGYIYGSGTSIRMLNNSNQRIINGDANGVAFLYYADSQRLVTTATGIDVFPGGATGQIRVGRNSGEQLAITVIDTNATLTYTQDEIDATPHNVIWNISSANTGERDYVWQNAGVEAMRLDRNGFLQVPGSINTRMALNTEVGTTYTFVLADSNKMVTLNNAAAITATIPANASVAYPTGTMLNIMQLGAGQVTVTSTDTVSVEAGLTLKLKGQYAVATALKINATQWILFGNLEAAP